MCSLTPRLHDAVWRAGVGIVLLLPVVFAVADPQVEAALKVTAVALAVLSAAVPEAGLLVVTLLLPLSLLFEIKFGAPPQAAAIVECLAFSFAGGAWFRVRSRADTGEFLAAPSLVLFGAIATTLVVQLSELQAIAPVRRVWQLAWIHVTRDYWHAPQDFAAIHLAWSWIACLATAVAAERIVRARPGMSRLFVVGWLAAGGLSACYAASRFMEVVLKGTGPVVDRVTWLLTNVRISALHPDPNAAGSLFILFLVPAVVLAIGWRFRGPPLVVLPLVLGAFVLAQSRAAIVGAVLVWALLWALRARRVKTIALGVGVTAAVLVIASVLTAPTHASATRALQLRVQMTEVGWRIASRYPAFGAGLGEYPRMSRRFTTAGEPEFAAFAPNGENAHNNFLQVLGELGVPAFCAFLWLTVPVAARVWPPTRAAPIGEREAMAAGIAAFLVTALSGHPLLIQQVAVTFFVGLGIAAGLAPSPVRRSWVLRVALAGVAFYAVSLVWRLG